jgi:hypothetical protein
MKPGAWFTRFATSAARAHLAGLPPSPARDALAVLADYAIDRSL